MQLFHIQNNETKTLENVIEKKIEEFLVCLKNDRELLAHVVSFGIVGPCARKQGFWYNAIARSDIDFFVLTSQISFQKNKQLKSLFHRIFEQELDCGLLIASKKHAYKKPDLMLYEFVNGGKLLYGEELQEINFQRISRFEVFRNILYRANFLLKDCEVKNEKISFKNLLSQEKFLYSYSKIIFSIEEVILILDDSYVANNFKRREKFLQKKLDRYLPGRFSEYYNDMFAYRYENKIPKDVDTNVYIGDACKFLEEIYHYIFKELYKGDSKKITLAHPGIPSMIISRLLYTFRSFYIYKKIRITFVREPFVITTQKFYKLLRKINSQETISQQEIKEILELCHVSPWMYHKI